MAATFKERSTFAGSRSRAQSPTPSAYHSGSQTFPTLKSSAGDLGGPTSPTHHGRRGILSRFKRHKDKDEGASGSLRNMPGSKASLALSRPPTLGKDDTAPQIPPWMGMPVPDPMESYSTRHGYQKQGATFNKNLFGKKSRSHRVHDGDDENIGPTDRHGLHVFHLDTNLSDMEGIVTKFPDKNIDTSLFSVSNDHDGDLKQPDFPSRIGGSWNAPDSWAVRRTTEDNIGAHLPELDENGMPHRVEERSTPYGIRVFRSDGTFATLQMPVNSTVSEVITQLLRKSLVNQSIETYHILLKKHNIVRVLSPFERPIVIQKRLLQEVGYEEADRIEEIGREDNSYLCRFLFLSEKDATFHSFTDHSGLTKLQKVNHVDLSGRNLLTIPISLYSKAGDIMALNLSRNLSLDLPRDFIQLCQNLRDIKFNNNEARKLPPSLSRANKLTYLDVSNNRLDSLDQAELGGLTGLIKLDLSNNRLKHLPPYFGAFRALRTLNISSNFLDTFPVFLCDLACLVDIDASFNAIGSLPDEIGNLKNLEKLVITNNRLAGLLPGTFNQLHSLRELDIKYNAITGIDVIAELPKLEILSADHNHISHFGGGFETIRRLKLNANPITRFEIKTMTPTLKDLNLSNAQLASIDESFNNMPNLERLVLDRNYFVSLPNQLGNLRRLETFSIANNVIAELPPEIGCLTELRVLDVRGNNIRKLPMEIWYANKLETLNASSNVLENFPKPSSRAPVPPSDSWNGSPSAKGSIASGATQSQGTDEASADGSRRPSQASSTLLSVGPSPVPGGADRKSSVVSVYGKGGRKTSVVSRTTSATSSAATPVSNTRKDSGLAARVTNTFAGSLRNLYLADNQLDDDVFDQIILLNELRVINLSYNVLTDMPQRSIKSWPQLVELYLSGNELTSLPADDLEEYSLLQVLHINGNKFQNLPADISRAKKLAVFDCGSNQLKYNIANVPYDWNWNLNPALRYLNLSGNKRLEIKESHQGSAARDRERYADFSRLQNLRILGLMDVTLTVNSIPDQNEDRRVRTTGSIAGFLPYGMADTMGKNEHLSTIDLLVPRFNSNDGETLLGLFDGINTLSGGSKIAKYLQENFGQVFAQELKALKNRKDDTPADALRRTFLSLNKDLATMAFSQTEDRPIMTTPRGGGSSPLVLTKEDLNSGGIATVAYLQNQDLYVANVGDTQAVLIGTDGSHRFLTRKHDPAEPSERQRIRDAGGWVSRNGKLNDFLDVSRAFGIIDLMPVVMASPHITKHTITEQDEMVVIATRELWEWVAPGLVVDIARSERGDLMRAAQKLRDLAMSYGAKDKIMVMAISVADLKRRVERSRMHRGQSMSLYPSGLPDEAALLPTRRGRKKMDVLDSTLQRLEAEVAPPTGWVAIVFTDIKNSTNLWETYPSAMRSAIKLHNEVMRRQLRRIGGYEVKTEGDAFMVSFPTATSSLLWAFSVQAQLLDVAWPPEMLNSVSCQEIRDKDDNVIFKGLSVRMGIHWGFPVSETDPVTRRMDYYGPMVNKASRISAVADGGQITVSADFIQEIQRCLMTYQDEDRANSIASGGPGGPDDAAGQSLLDDDQMAAAIRKELRMLSSIGFEVKDLGEIKLKGLENPELVYSLYPHSLVGRVEYHLAHHARVNNAEAPAAVAAAAAAASAAAEGKPATLIPGSMLSFDPEVVWAIWKVSLRLEMLCSSLEEVSGRGLQPPETELLDRMKQRGGEVTERFIMNFLEHQISRIEVCISNLSLYMCMCMCMCMCICICAYVYIYALRYAYILHLRTYTLYVYVYVYIYVRR